MQTEGYALAEPATIPEAKGVIGEATAVFKQAFANAQRDIQRGNYFTPDVVLCSMPFIFVILLFIVIAIPFSEPEVQPRKKRPTSDESSKSD